MGEWREYKISDIADVIGGGTPKTSVDEYWNGDIPWLAPRDLTGYDKVYISHGDRFITEEGLKKSSTKLMPKGSVLLTSRAPIGYVAIAQNEICTNQGFKSLVPKKDLCYSEFLYYWIKSNVDYLQQLGTGTTFTEISGSVVKNIDILLPPLKEQKAIAEVLSSLDDKIDLLHRQNKTLEALAQTLFRQWFIEDAKDEWEEKPLKEICEIKNGFAFKSKDYKDIGRVIVRTKNFNNGFVNLDDVVYIDLEEEQEYIKYKLQQYDFLLVMVGASIGKSSIVTSDILPALQNQNMWNFRSLGNISQHYLNFALKNIVQENLGSASGSARDFFQKGQFYKFLITIPDKEKLNIFDEYANNTYNKLEVNRKQIKTLENMRNTLLPKLMSGEVRVEI
ncbi:MAG: restriction endonuclease subunit S [Sulfurovum sp.]|nr:restriction endonuclease subunit S [Sulfurovum sp.]